MTTAKLVSRKDTAAALGVSLRTVDRLRSSGQLDTFRVRGRAMVTAASIDRYLGTDGDATAESPEPPRLSRWAGFEIPALDNLLAQKQRAREEREAA